MIVWVLKLVIDWKSMNASAGLNFPEAFCSIKGINLMNLTILNLSNDKVLHDHYTYKGDTSTPNYFRYDWGNVIFCWLQYIFPKFLLTKVEESE